MPISIQQISYIHPDKEVLFSDLNFAISKGQKLGLVGNNLQQGRFATAVIADES